MTPFGASPALGLKKAEEISPSTETSLARRLARVRFSPDHQVLHGPTKFSVIIEDPDGVPEDFRLLVSYNGVDVTRAFLRQATVAPSDPLRHEVRVTANSLRLPAGIENRVKVVYWRDPEAPPVMAQYMPPVCSAFTGNQMIFALPEFESSANVIQLINQHASMRRLNPYFVAALVAQESSFNPLAVSPNHALGLTQVTPMGEMEIIRRYKDWPRYPGVSDMPFPLLKLAVIGGRIHSGNEWRLDPTLSIQGGIEYLSYLGEYWTRPDKRAQVERKLGPSETALSEVLLASYNSGAARVAEALERSGERYLEDSSLGEANKYVRRVVSYCDHFEHQEE
jgi:soluble lytic murein transglycosylase-like protein